LQNAFVRGAGESMRRCEGWNWKGPGEGEKHTTFIDYSEKLKLDTHPLHLGLGAGSPGGAGSEAQGARTFPSPPSRLLLVALLKAEE